MQEGQGSADPDRSGGRDRRSRLIRPQSSVESADSTGSAASGTDVIGEVEDLQLRWAGVVLVIATFQLSIQFYKNTKKYLWKK